MKTQRMEEFLEMIARSNFGRSRKDPVCVTCGSEKIQDSDFRDQLSWQEFEISRMWLGHRTRI